MERNWREKVFIHLGSLTSLVWDYLLIVCLFIIFLPCIQKSLDETLASWNLHKFRTTKNKTPLAIYELGREMAINRGYSTGNPGDDLATASHPSYGGDGSAPLPPSDELANDPEANSGFGIKDANQEGDHLAHPHHIQKPLGLSDCI
jgi:hypothetical protein